MRVSPWTPLTKPRLQRPPQRSARLLSVRCESGRCEPWPACGRPASSMRGGPRSPQRSWRPSVRDRAAPTPRPRCRRSSHAPTARAARSGQAPISSCRRTAPPPHRQRADPEQGMVQKKQTPRRAALGKAGRRDAGHWRHGTRACNGADQGGREQVTMDHSGRRSQVAVPGLGESGLANGARVLVAKALAEPTPYLRDGKRRPVEEARTSTSASLPRLASRNTTVLPHFSTRAQTT